VPALRGVSLAVERKEVIAVTGPSGCGKTTLLNCLSGLDAADTGDIVIEGSELTEMSDYQRTDYRARRMDFVFQFYNLLPVLSAVENVEMPLLVSGVRPHTARQQALDALAQVGLAERANHRPAELSGGERQRVTLSRALVNNPVIVWADEPTGDLDSETADQVMDLLIRLNHERDLTFLLVTHAASRRAVHASCRCVTGRLLANRRPHKSWPNSVRSPPWRDPPTRSNATALGGSSPQGGACPRSLRWKSCSASK
jgi:ABC-type lipoprotein export system ATPase subunit